LIVIHLLLFRFDVAADIDKAEQNLLGHLSILGEGLFDITLFRLLFAIIETLVCLLCGLFYLVRFNLRAFIGLFDRV